MIERIVSMGNNREKCAILNHELAPKTTLNVEKDALAQIAYYPAKSLGAISVEALSSKRG
jgi:hypothetical protein